MIPFITSRSSTWRLFPPRLAGGINGSISAHSSSVRSLGYRNALRSYRPRFFDVHIGDPPRIRPPLLNHKRLTGFNMFSDRHLEKAPKHDAITLCANSDGRPWTISGYRASWRKARITLEKAGRVGPALTLYGLRHTAAGIRRASGYDSRT